jgi:hypothetical protein
MTIIVARYHVVLFSPRPMKTLQCWLQQIRCDVFQDVRGTDEVCYRQFITRDVTFLEEFRNFEFVKDGRSCPVDAGDMLYTPLDRG